VIQTSPLEIKNGTEGIPFKHAGTGGTIPWRRVTKSGVMKAGLRMQSTFQTWTYLRILRETEDNPIDGVAANEHVAEDQQTGMHEPRFVDRDLDADIDHMVQEGAVNKVDNFRVGSSPEATRGNRCVRIPRPGAP